MSGVQVGSRLDRLRELERAVRVQIELEVLAELRQHATDERCAAYPATDPAPATTSPASPERPTLVRVPVDHVAGPVIRQWAAANRYSVPERGRITDFVRGAFIEAHQ